MGEVGGEGKVHSFFLKIIIYYHGAKNIFFFIKGTIIFPKCICHHGAEIKLFQRYNLFGRSVFSNVRENLEQTCCDSW